MRLSDEQLQLIWDRGYVVVERFVPPDLLREAQDALWTLFPRPEDYFAAPERYEQFGRTQFDAMQYFPFAAQALNRLAVMPDLVDAAERFCGSQTLDIYKIELWAKYAGAIDYDQPHHFDFDNHSLVVPKKADRTAQMTCFILLSDVTSLDSPTKVVPVDRTRHVPLVPNRQPMGAFFDQELEITAPAGSLFIYRTDVMHRGSNFTAAKRSRFVYLVDFQARGKPWTGKIAWPDRANSTVWSDALAPMTPRERELFGFPAVGDPYWDAQTLADVQLRYPAMDMTPYREAAAAGGGVPA